MPENLLADEWRTADSYELRLLLDKHIGGPGQYDRAAGIPQKFYLPLARSSCRVAIVFRDREIVAIEPGPAFDAVQWVRVREEITRSLFEGGNRIGREYSFCGFRVQGSWRGTQSRLQILPPPNDAPEAPVEMADHPFILEFPLLGSDFWRLTNHRRTREHRQLTLLLNVLLTSGTTFQPSRSPHCWAIVPLAGGVSQSIWVQQSYSARLGDVVLDDLLPPAATRLRELDPEEYYAQSGYDGEGLRVPTDLDESISRYLRLPHGGRTKFDRAAFWMDMAARQWEVSVSASFAALVSAVEALTDRGTTHRVYCETCQSDSQHEAPGATERFRAFFEEYAPGASLRNRRSQMYSLRSGILHGSDLMQMDQDVAFGWDPPGWNERQLHDELWSITRLALRNWLKRPPETILAS
jgi:hypothetical protein